MKKLTKSLREGRNWSTIGKMLMIGVLLLVFLIPLQMIRSLIEERNATRMEAEGEIIRSWGGEQILAGPVVVVPYLYRIEDEEGQVEELVDRAFFLPEALVVSGSVDTEKRSRGIYEVTVYTTDLEVSGSFPALDFRDWRIAEKDILWEDASLVVELPDMRGLQQRVTLQWDAHRLPFTASQGELGLFGGEISAALPVGAGDAFRPGHSFSFGLHLQGGRSLSFLPLGEENRVHLVSTWTSPNFNGAFLPAERSYGEKGFEADWYVLSLGRGYSQSWLQGEVNEPVLLGSAFGVELMIPVDTYLKTLRSVKYGILFVLLPFLTFFLFETASGRRIHPFQYLLVGLAVCLFYLLLVSVSEHLSFDWTYLVSSLATVALITFYSAAVLSAWRRAWVLALVLGAGYVFLYAALKSEDYALLIGSLGLFVILSAVMVLTRKLDWYRLGAGKSGARAGGTKTGGAGI
jgi:inner membrane protein